MANTNGHGGPRPGAGRKPKEDELGLITKLRPYDDMAIEKLITGVERNDIQCLKLFLEYRFGKAKQIVEGFMEGGVILNGFRSPLNEPINGLEIKENGTH